MRSETGLACLGLVALFVIVVAIATALIALAWAWVVPDVFAGAVDQGVLPASITLMQALKLSILLGLLGVAGKASSSSKK